MIMMPYDMTLVITVATGRPLAPHKQWLAPGPVGCDTRRTARASPYLCTSRGSLGAPSTLYCSIVRINIW